MYSVSEIQRIVAPIAQRHGVERMTLFGSYARGENTPNSDIDLRIDRGQRPRSANGFFIDRFGGCAEYKGGFAVDFSVGRSVFIFDTWRGKADV